MEVEEDERMTEVPREHLWVIRMSGVLCGVLKKRRQRCVNVWSNICMSEERQTVQPGL